MLPNQQTNSDFTDANQLQQNQQLSQQNIITKLFREQENDFTKWPAHKQALAVGAVGAILPTALLVLAAVLVPALPGAIVALTLFLAVKAVSYAVQGMKWSADMVVKGAKHSKDEVIKGYKHSRDSLKRGASFVKEQTKETTSNMLHATANKLYNAAGATNYLQKIKDFSSEEKEKSEEIRNDMKAIFNDKGNNARLVENILSKMGSTIDSKITSKKAEELTSSVDDYVNNNTLIGRWNEQKKFISALDTGKLQNLLTKRSLPKDSYFIDSIFSEHYDQIKKIIPECKTTHLQINTFKNDTPSLKKEDRTLQASRKIRSEISYGEVDDAESVFSSICSSLSKKKKTSNSPDSDSVKTERTDSTVGSEAELLSPTKHKKVKKPGFFSFSKNKVADIEVSTGIEYQTLPSTPPATIGRRSRFYMSSPIPVASPTVPKQRLDSLGSNISHSNSTSSVNSVASDASFLSASSKLSGSESANSFSSYRRHSDSGVSSPGSSTPKRSSSMRNINNPDLSQIQEAKKSLKKTGSLEKLVGQQPGTRFTVKAEVHAQPTQVAASQVSVKG